MVELEAEVDGDLQRVPRPTSTARPVDDNTISRILRTSDDSDERRAAWEASKQVGARGRRPGASSSRGSATVLPGTSARRDHFALSLATGELDEERLFATLDEVDRVTAEPFAAWKAELDDALASRFGCTVDELRPWHYDDPFFQEPPAEGAVDLDPWLARQRSRGADRPDLRRDRARRPRRRRPQRPAAPRREEPARVLHRRRPRGRRPRAQQQLAVRVLGRDDAPRVRPRDLRPPRRPRPPLAAARDAPAHDRGRRDALRSAGAAIRSGSAPSPA